MNDKTTAESIKKATFLFGLPDSRAVRVGGVDNKGDLVYSWPGNSDFNNYIKTPGLTKKFISVIWHAEPQRNIEKPDIIINCINDADISKKSLNIAIQITNSIRQRWPDVKVFNNPSAIARTTRDKIYEQFHHLPDLYIPKVIRIAPSGADEVLELAAKAKLDFPFLMRECGAHESTGLQVIRNQEDRVRLEKYAYDGREFYLTEFVNNKNSEGFYNKVRFVIIGGKIYARHFMTSPQWMVHADVHYHYMAENEAAKKAEQNFIGNYKTIISSQALAALEKINADLGLDYLGFDVAPMPDGRLLVFEINVAQNALLSIDFEKFPYMKENKERIVQGLNDTVNQILSQ
jgi:glutathione synthase/RimK-type ligase-like ATP-grasp enzyme